MRGLLGLAAVLLAIGCEGGDAAKSGATMSGYEVERLVNNWLASPESGWKDTKIIQIGKAKKEHGEITVVARVRYTGQVMNQRAEDTFKFRIQGGKVIAADPTQAVID